MGGHSSPISGIDSYGNMVATAGYDNTVILWNKKNQNVLAKQSHNHLVNHCQFSPCGQFLVTSSSDYTAKIWKVPSLELISTLTGHTDDVEMSCFHPNRKIVATASRDHRIGLFDFKGTLLRQFKGHKVDVISLTWNQKGDKLLSSSDDGTVRIWDLELKNSQVIDLNGIETDTLAIFPDDILYAGNDSGEIQTIQEGHVLVSKKYFSSGIKRLIKDEKRNFLLALSYDQKMILFKKMPEGKLLPLNHSHVPDCVWIRSACFSDNQILFATFGQSYASFHINSQKWETSKVGKTKGINALLFHNKSLYSIGDSGQLKKDGQDLCNLKTLQNFLCPVGKTILSGGHNGLIYDALTGKELYQLHLPLNDAISWEKENRTYLAVGLYTGEIVFFLYSSQVLTFLKRVSALANAVKSLTHDSETLFAVGAAGDACWIDLKSFSLSNHCQLHSKIANACTNLGKGHFASVGRDLGLNLIRYGKLTSVKTPHKNSIKAICANNERDILATGSYGGELGLYSLSAQEWIFFEKISPNGISSLCFNDDTKNFEAASYNGNIYALTVPLEVSLV